MNQKGLSAILIIAIIMFVAAIATGGRLIFKKRSGNPTTNLDPMSSASNPCLNVFVEYKSQCEQFNSWLDQKLIEWKPSEYKPMDFGVYHVQASDDQFVKTNSDIDFKILDAIMEVNPGTVVLYIRPKEYFSQKERYDNLINRIRSNGKKLFIGARFDDTKMNFSDYDKALNDYTKNIIAETKPDFYGIIIEPETMGRKHSFEASDADWVSLAERISELSKQLSPGTKTVVAGHKEELSFLRLASDIKDLDIVGFDIYGMEGIYPEYAGNLGKGDIVGDAIDYANLKGKQTWILETWTSAMVNTQQKAISIEEFMKPIDAKWIWLMVYYAQKHNMNAIVPFYTGKFVYYGFNQNEFVSALNGKQRTPAFEAYKAIIEEFKNKPQ